MGDVGEFIHSPVLLWRTSPRGPPIEGFQETGTQLACLGFRSIGEEPTPSPISSSRGDDVTDMKSDVAVGIEIERWVLGQSSMNCLSGCCDLLVLSKGLSKESEHTNPKEDSWGAVWCL